MNESDALIGAIIVAGVRRAGGSTTISAIVDRHMVTMPLPMKRERLLESFARVAGELSQCGLLVVEGDAVRRP